MFFVFFLSVCGTDKKKVIQETVRLIFLSLDLLILTTTRLHLYTEVVNEGGKYTLIIDPRCHKHSNQQCWSHTCASVFTLAVRCSNYSVNTFHCKNISRLNSLYFFFVSLYFLSQCCVNIALPALDRSTEGRTGPDKSIIEIQD